MKPFAVINTHETYREDYIIPSDCQSIAFKNIGTLPCTIADFPLNPGDGMYSISNPNPLAVDITQYSLKFDKNAVGTKKVMVVRTFHDFTKTPQQNINK